LGAGFAAATWAGLPYDPALAAAGRTVRFKDGAVVPALGQGSWHLGQGRHPLAAEEDAMTLGISLGLTVLDTAELYGSGRAEAMIAQVIAGQRDRVFVVSKVMPSHATASGIKRACAGSLSRLKTDHLDLYLLHWRDGILDLAEVVDTFEGLRDAGKIRRWGVSNFGVRDMEELFQVPNGAHCAANQVVYSLANRDIERDLLPWCTQHGMPIMAYSPLGGSGSDLLRNQALNAVATAHGQSPSAVALAWTMRGGNAISIPESGSADHVRENAAALSLDLTPQDLQALDTAFPA
jgi:diketogulonate reductase-like aldo/keto reductase